MAETNYKKVDNYYYDPSKILGKGAFAAVYKAFEERSNTTVAVKVVPSTKLLESEDQYNLFMREINVLRQIRGEHIVRLLDVKRTTNNLYIFTDYCDGGDLEKKIKAKHAFTEEEALAIVKQIADAFVTIENLQIVNDKNHKVVIMHRDIKAANILFHEGRIKVADFGFAKLIDEVDRNTKKAHTLLGTPLYMAPQILNDENYSTKCDIWSTGVLFYEIIFGKLPWTGHSVPNLYNNIKTKPLAFPKKISSETKDLVEKMLKMKEDDRLSWKEVFNHPALKNINISKPDNSPIVSPTIPTQQQPTTQNTVQQPNAGYPGYNAVPQQQNVPQTQTQTQTQPQTQTQQQNPVYPGYPLQGSTQQQQEQRQNVYPGYPSNTQQQAYPQSNPTQQTYPNYTGSSPYNQQASPYSQQPGYQQGGYPQQGFPQQAYPGYQHQGSYPQQNQQGYPQQNYQGYQHQGSYPQQPNPYQAYQRGNSQQGYPKQ